MLQLRRFRRGWVRELSMSDDIKTAFSHPLARAEALATERPLDRISVRDHVVEIEIGAFQAERDLTQRISFNVVVEVYPCLLYTSPSPRDLSTSRMPSSA